MEVTSPLSGTFEKRYFGVRWADLRLIGYATASRGFDHGPEGRNHRCAGGVLHHDRPLGECQEFRAVGMG